MNKKTPIIYGSNIYEPNYIKKIENHTALIIKKSDKS